MKYSIVIFLLFAFFSSTSQVYVSPVSSELRYHHGSPLVIQYRFENLSEKEASIDIRQLYLYLVLKLDSIDIMPIYREEGRPPEPKIYVVKPHSSSLVEIKYFFLDKFDLAIGQRYELFLGSEAMTKKKKNPLVIMQVFHVTRAD